MERRSAFQPGKALYTWLMGFLLVSYLYLTAIGSEIDDIPIWIWILRVISVPLAFWYGKLWKDRIFLLLGVFFAWFTLRAFIPNPTSFFSLDLSTNILSALWLFASCFGLGRVLNERELKRFLGICAGIWIAGMVVSASLGITAAWRDIRISSLKEWYYARRNQPLNNQTNLFWGITDQHRLALPFYWGPTSGAYMSMTAVTSIVMAASVKNKACKALYILAVFPLVLALALTDSRTAFVTVAAGFGVLALIGVLRTGEKKRAGTGGKPWYVWLGAGTALVLVFGATILVLLKTTPAFNEVRRRGLLISAAMAESTTTKAEFVSRGFTGDNVLTDRPQIWRAALDYIREHPLTLIFGKSKDGTMSGVHPWAAHTHCMPLMVLLESGIPGLLLYLAFLVSMGIRTFRVVRRAELPLWLRMLAAVPVSILAGEPVECLTWLRAVQAPMVTVYYLTLGVLNVYGRKTENNPPALQARASGKEDRRGRRMTFRDPEEG